ncbi:MAG: AAA family ATPase [Actinomycetota bacterium]
MIADTEAPEIETLPILGRFGYIAVGTSNLLSAYAKDGKTTLLVAMLREWAQAGKRIVVLTEEPELVWQHRINAEPEIWRNVTFVFAIGAGAAVAVEEAFSGDESIVVIDTIRNVIGFENENDNAEIPRVLNPFIARAREEARTLLMTHHANKVGGAHGRGIAGAGALFGVVDSALEITRVPGNGAEKRRKLKCTGRLLMPEDLLYEMRDDESLAALGSPSLVEAVSVRRRVLDVLADEPATLASIRDDLGDPPPGRENVRKALSFLVNEGDAKLTGEGKRGDPHRWERNFVSPTLGL